MHRRAHTVHAYRTARGRDEWQSAVLHNSGTQCNALLPLYGAGVGDSVFAVCLARFVSDVQSATNIADITPSMIVHDLKWLLRRYVCCQSFSNDTGGGGTESNINVSVHAHIYTTVHHCSYSCVN